MGAVFLDSGHCLKTVWEVYLKLCLFLDDVVANPPLNMKKQLLERFPGKVIFGKAEMEEDKATVVVTVEVRDGQTTRNFRGRGDSKKLAEVAASKCALRCYTSN